MLKFDNSFLGVNSKEIGLLSAMHIWFWLSILYIVSLLSVYLFCLSIFYSFGFIWSRNVSTVIRLCVLLMEIQMEGLLSFLNQKLNIHFFHYLLFEGGKKQLDILSIAIDVFATPKKIAPGNNICNKLLLLCTEWNNCPHLTLINFRARENWLTYLLTYQFAPSKQARAVLRPRHKPGAPRYKGARRAAKKTIIAFWCLIFSKILTCRSKAVTSF